LPFVTLPPAWVADPDRPTPDDAATPDPADSARVEESALVTDASDIDVRSVDMRSVRRAPSSTLVAERPRRGPVTASAPRTEGWWRPIDFGVVFLFLLGGWIVTSLMWVDPVHATTAANGTDQAFFEWMLSHGVRVFTHGENPLFTSQMNAPLGVNLMSNTGLLGLAIPFAPLTAWFGPSAVFVLIIMLGLSGTAFAWYYVLARHLVHHRLAAFVGATFCGFGPGIVTHTNAHPNLTAQFVIPFIVWRALALRSSRRPVRDGVILGVLVTYQVFLNEELLFLTALAGCLFVGGYLAFRPKAFRPAIRPVSIGLGVAAGVTLPLVAYPLWYQFYGPQHFNGLPLFLQSYRLPLKSFITLPTMSLWGQPTTLASSTEQNSFLGWAIVIAALATVVLLWRRRPEVRVLAIIGFLFAYASLGDLVSVNGADAHRVSLWSHLNKVVLFDSVLPSRLALVLVPVVGVLIAFGVADAAAAGRAAIRSDNALKLSGAVLGAAGLVAAVITILPTPVPTAPRPVVPHFFTSGDWKPYVPAGSSVLSATPYDYIPTMQWAIATGLDIRVPGGYFLGPEAKAKDAAHPNQFRGQYGPVYRNTMMVLGSVGNDTWHLQGDVAYWQQKTISDLAYWHTSIIVLTADQPNGAESKQTIDTLLGRPGLQVDDVWLWDVRWTWTAAKGQ
jgi:hypothetical protein